MQLNKVTHDILKNFSEINTNILIKPGSELNTISTMRNIFAKATITESFDNEFGIYDLNEFLSVVSSLDKPSLTLQDKYMTISTEGSKSKAKYFYSDPSVIVSPKKDVNMPESDVIDWDEAMEQCGDDEEFLRELLSDLRHEVDTQWHKIDAAVEVSHDAIQQ